jgi:hypothetical protein
MARAHARQPPDRSLAKDPRTSGGLSFLRRDRARAGYPRRRSGEPHRSAVRDHGPPPAAPSGGGAPRNRRLLDFRDCLAPRARAGNGSLASHAGPKTAGRPTARGVVVSDKHRESKADRLRSILREADLAAGVPGLTLEEREVVRRAWTAAPSARPRRSPRLLLGLGAVGCAAALAVVIAVTQREGVPAPHATGVPPSPAVVRPDHVEFIAQDGVRIVWYFEPLQERH